jgi:hypothetical protein
VQETLPLARTTDPMPSHTAAESVTKETVSRSHQAVLDVLRMRPLMAWEAVLELAHLPISSSRIESSFPELERKGRVKVVGEGTTPFGRPARIWSLA